MSIKSVKQIPHRTFNAGEIIYSVDEQSQNVFLIHSGQVAIETRLGLNVGILNEGEIFGEVGHITVKPRTVTARAETKCIVKVIDEDTLKVRGFVGVPMFGETQIWSRVTNFNYDRCED